MGIGKNNEGSSAKDCGLRQLVVAKIFYQTDIIRYSWNKYKYSRRVPGWQSGTRVPGNETGTRIPVVRVEYSTVAWTLGMMDFYLDF